MDSHEIMERFRQFTAADLFSKAPGGTTLASEVLFETGSVRMVLTRYEDNVEEAEVDIEVSLPSLPRSYDKAVFQRFIDVMIEILEYLKRLGSIGFGIELLREEGLLVASGSLSTDAKEHVFEILGSWCPSQID
jgi:hypothetical protein